MATGSVTPTLGDLPFEPPDEGTAEPARSPADARATLPSATGPVVDLVIPVYNEAHVLATSVDRLADYLADRFPLTWRITVVDNASTDGTWAVAQQLETTVAGVRAIHLDSKGRGLALRQAWLATDGRVVAYMDVDLSTDLDALLPLVAPLVSGHSDLAVGCRLAPSSRVARAPKRELISRTYNLILRTVFGTRVRDAQCGFKAVRADVARRLLPDVVDDAWFFDTELLLLAERNGLRIHEVPVDWVDDPDSRVDVRQTALDDLRGVWRLARTFGAGRGFVELGRANRPGLVDDMGRQLVAFGLVGGVSTTVSLLLFLLLRSTLGVVGATVVALGATAFANLWANRRWTFGRTDAAGRSRYYARSGPVLAAGMALSVGLLALVDVADGGLLDELVTLLLAWSITMLARFRLLRRWAFPLRART
jgi:putative flippase GtrA